VLAHADLLVRDARFAQAHRPELVLQLGRAATSKAQRLWLEAEPPEHWVHVDPDQCGHDPSKLVTQRWCVDPQSLFEVATSRLPPRARSEAWRSEFQSADALADRLCMDFASKEVSLSAPELVREIASTLPADSLLFASNSMAVRDLDAYWPKDAAPRRVLANRGASGIDGVTSSAMGAAAALYDEGASALLLTGDLAFLHDLGAVLAAKARPLRLTVVVVNDQGGGIFSMLPVAKHGEALAFDRFFRTPQSADLSALGAFTGLHFETIQSREHLGRALKDSFSASEAGLCVLEVPVDGAANHASRRALQAQLEQELSAVEGQA